MNNCGTCYNICPVPANAGATCVKGACGVVCKPDYGDCDGNSVNGCETYLPNDPKNCGACGRDCLGGACSLGVCQPILVDDSLTYSDGCCTSFAQIDTTTIYIDGRSSTSWGIYALPKTGGVPVAVAPTAGLVRFAIDSTNAYWPDYSNGKIGRVAKTGGTPSVLSTQEVGLNIAADGTAVYWGSVNGTADILRVPVSGGTTTVLGTSAVNCGVYDLATDGSSVFALECDSQGSNVYTTIEAVPVTGGALKRLVTPQPGAPGMILLGTDHVYWSTQSANGFGSVGLFGISKSGGPITTIMAGVAQFAMDTQYAYFDDASLLSVEKVLLDGSSFAPIPVTSFAPYNSATVLAVDDKFVYFVRSDGGLYKAAK